MFKEYMLIKITATKKAKDVTEALYIYIYIYMSPYLEISKDLFM